MINKAGTQEGMERNRLDQNTLHEPATAGGSARLRLSWLDGV